MAHSLSRLALCSLLIGPSLTGCETANVDKAVATPQGFYVGLEVTGAGAVHYGKLIDGGSAQ